MLTSILSGLLAGWVLALFGFDSFLCESTTMQAGHYYVYFAIGGFLNGLTIRKGSSK